MPYTINTGVWLSKTNIWDIINDYAMYNYQRMRPTAEWNSWGFEWNPTSFNTTTRKKQLLCAVFLHRHDLLWNINISFIVERYFKPSLSTITYISHWKYLNSHRKHFTHIHIHILQKSHHRLQITTIVDNIDNLH